MKRVGLLVTLNAIWALGVTVVVVAVLALVIGAVNDIHTLLLSGKTASAISAKKTARNTDLLLQQQAFDHAQSQNGTEHLRVVVREVERHLDRTIRRSVAREAQRFERGLKR